MMLDLKELNARKILKMIPARIMRKFFEFIGWKGIVFVTTIILMLGKVFGEGSGWVWISIVLILVFDKKALDIIKEIRK